MNQDKSVAAAGTDHPRLVVIGGGAAGFFCAVNAARFFPSLKVIIVEKTSKILAKVKVSGGGRCNVTHACFEISNLIKKYPRGTHFLKKALHQFSTRDCVDWFEERGVKLKTEADGRMFSITDSSQTIIDCLLHEANTYSVEIWMNAEVQQIMTVNNSFSLQLSGNRHVQADFVCIACGGYPKATMFQWLQQLGHTIELPVPSLFTFNMPGNDITQLMGVSVGHVKVKIAGSKLAEEGPLLITHWGLSGPAVLKLSAWGARELADLQYHFSILINWLGTETEQVLRDRWSKLRTTHAAQKISNRNPFGLPERLWLYLLQQSNISPDIRWGDLPAKEQNKLINNLTAQELTVQGKTTFKEEFVTCGGIKLGEINAITMESKLVKGLYFAGEVMDVDGVTGGFNFQHAWTSGFIAARSIAQRLPKNPA